MAIRPRELAFFRAQAPREEGLSVGPLMVVGGVDQAAINIAANTTSSLVWTSNTVNAGSYVPPGQNEIYVFEAIWAQLFSADNSGKLRLDSAAIFLGDAYAGTQLGSTPIGLSGFGAAMPFTWPAISGYPLPWIAKLPIPALVGGPVFPAPAASVSPNGPAAWVILTNTDAAIRTYKRGIQMFIRKVTRADFTTGPALRD